MDTQIEDVLHPPTPHWTHDRLEKCSFCEQQRHYHARHSTSPSARHARSPRLSTLPVCERDGGQLTRHPFRDDHARLCDGLPLHPSLKHGPVQVDTPLHPIKLPPPPPPTPDVEAQHSRARLLQREKQRYRARQDTFPSTHTRACHSLPNLSSLLPPSHSKPCWSTVLL
ncbi:hypothetical protein BJV77DRAFT_631933 [Russula vinacea]|nr:hypothetical protein BJV77DRAFT_631933 [Russula vinacea]